MAGGNGEKRVDISFDTGHNAIYTGPVANMSQMDSAQFSLDCCPLSRVECGYVGRVRHLDDACSGVCALRRLGMTEGCLVECLGASNPVLLRLAGSKVAVDRTLLGSVLVESMPAA